MGDYLKRFIRQDKLTVEDWEHLFAMQTWRLKVPLEKVTLKKLGDVYFPREVFYPPIGLQRYNFEGPVECPEDVKGMTADGLALSGIFPGNREEDTHLFKRRELMPLQPSERSETPTVFGTNVVQFFAFTRAAEWVSVEAHCKHWRSFGVYGFSAKVTKAVVCKKLASEALSEMNEKTRQWFWFAMADVVEAYFRRRREVYLSAEELWEGVKKEKELLSLIFDEK